MEIKILSVIVQIFHRNNHVPNVGIPTNGSLTARVVEMVRDVLDSCPDLDLMVDVSIDGIGKDHDEIRRVKGLFDKAMETFKELKKIEKECLGIKWSKMKKHFLSKGPGRLDD